MPVMIVVVFAVIEHKSGNDANAERLLKIAISQGLDKLRIRAWLNNGKAGEDLISDLNSIAILDQRSFRMNKKGTEFITESKMQMSL